MRSSFSPCYHNLADSRTQPVSNVLNIGVKRSDVDHTPPFHTMVQFNLRAYVNLHGVAARVQSRVCPSGICGGRSGAGAGFHRVLRFPLPFIPPNSPSSQSPGAGTIGQ
jgi:hypothetical protein